MMIAPSLSWQALLPWFLRLPVLAHFRDYHLPDDVPRLRRLAATNADRPSVKVGGMAVMSRTCLYAGIGPMAPFVARVLGRSWQSSPSLLLRCWERGSTSSPAAEVDLH